LGSSGWYAIGEGKLDYSYDVDDAAFRAVPLLVPAAQSQAELRVRDCSEVWIEVRPTLVEVLTGGVPMQLFCRRIGLGRVRRDGSTPLRPSHDGVWIQAVQGEAVLVMRRGPGEDYAFVPLGELTPKSREHAAVFGYLRILLLVSDTFMDRPTWRAMNDLVASQQAWGGLVTCIEEG
jgi:hypothetical protein